MGASSQYGRISENTADCAVIEIMKSSNKEKARMPRAFSLLDLNGSWTVTGTIRSTIASSIAGGAVTITIVASSITRTITAVVSGSAIAISVSGQK